MLPNNYVRLDYIESSGTQYIDTGILFKKGFRCDIRYSYTQIEQDKDVLGCDGFGGLFSILLNLYNNKNRMVVYNAGTSYVSSTGHNLVANTIYNNTIEYNSDNSVTIADNDSGGGLWNKVNSTPEYSMLASLYLFGRHNFSSAGNLSKARVYSVKFYDNGTLTKDLIPTKNDTNEIGLYDLVNNQFYGNDGTGTFTYGHELPQNITLEDNPLTWQVQDNVSLIANFKKTYSVFIKNNNEWLRTVPYIKVNGEWKEASMVKIKNNGTWK